VIQNRDRVPVCSIPEVTDLAIVFRHPTGSKRSNGEHKNKNSIIRIAINIYSMDISDPAMIDQWQLVKQLDEAFQKRKFQVALIQPFPCGEKCWTYGCLGQQVRAVRFETPWPIPCIRSRVLVSFLQVAALSRLICSTLDATDRGRIRESKVFVGLFLDTSFAYIVGVLAVLRTA